MTDIKKYRSVAVPVPTWEMLWEIAQRNHRSPAQQIAWLVDLAHRTPTDGDIVKMFTALQESA
jgi:hypothetical protein|tara:strand:- start:770 stop:958 length:189 start_codon:yes stop_codon:yes gene_type:complete